MIKLKHFAIILATAMMAVANTACGDNDEPDTPGKQPITDGATYASRQLAVTGNGANRNIDYLFKLNKAGTLMDIYTDHANGYGTGDLPDVYGVKLSKVAGSCYSYASTKDQANTGDKTTVKNPITVSGYIDTANGTFLTTLRDEDGSSPVVITSTSRKILSSLPGGSMDYANTADTYFEVVLSDDNTKADIYLHNIQFVSSMPKQKKLGIMGVSASVSGTVITLSASEITPLLYDASGNATPMPSRKVTNLSATVNWASNDKSTLKFTCFGLDYSTEFLTQFGALLK